MAKNLNLNKLFADNPKADKDAVKRARSQIDSLRKAGIAQKGYELAPPFSNRPLLSRKVQS